MKIEGTHALVTGGGRRVGKAIAQALAARGARVTVHVRHSLAQAQEWVNEGGHRAGDCAIEQADLLDPAAIGALAQRAQARFGPVGLLVNSASSFFPTPALETSAAQWNELFELNLRAPFLLSNACLAGMLAAGGGCVVNICDIHVERPLVRFAPYCATKGGLWSLTRALSLEWAPKVRVCSVSPGPVLLPENFTPEQVQRHVSQTPLGLGRPEDVAQAVLFLAGNDYITGFDLKVDGGQSLTLRID